jgi:cbb3-type cytochrome oxidase maturation protein
LDALILTMFVSLVLGAGGVAMFAWLVRARTFDHADRLALLPLEDDPASPSSATPAARALDPQHRKANS